MKKHLGQLSLENKNLETVANIINKEKGKEVIKKKNIIR